MSAESTKRDACELALRKLAARERTENEIRAYLRSMKIDDDEAAKAISYLMECGYIDDERYCMKYYEYARSKNKAVYRIVRELEQKGIPSSFARQVIEKMSDDPQYSEVIVEDKEAALAAGLKMNREREASGKPADDKFYARVGRRLLSLGYGSSVCYYVIGKIRSKVAENE